MSLIGLVITALAGPFLVGHLEVNFFYYSQLAYGLGESPAAAARFLRDLLVDYGLDPSTPLAVLQTGGLAAIVLLHAAAWRRDPRRSWAPWLASAWIGLGIPLFMVFALQTAADPSAALYALPGLFAMLLTPGVVSGDAAARRALGRASVGLVLLAVVIGGRAAGTGWRWATQPYRDADYNHAWVVPALRNVPDEKAFDAALAEALVRQGHGLVWNAFFDETGHIQTMEGFRRSGNLVLPAGPRYFSIHEPYWRGFYPRMSPAEVSERVYAATRLWVDVAVVLGDPSSADTVTSRVNEHVANPYTRQVARDIAERVRSDPGWRPVFELRSARYGRVVGYRNLESQGRGYQRVLESHEIFASSIDP
jgi:hypothetical protein